MMMHDLSSQQCCAMKEMQVPPAACATLAKAAWSFQSVLQLICLASALLQPQGTSGAAQATGKPSGKGSSSKKQR
jgi:hypothetical protein